MCLFFISQFCFKYEDVVLYSFFWKKNVSKAKQVFQATSISNTCMYHAYHIKYMYVSCLSYQTHVCMYFQSVKQPDIKPDEYNALWSRTRPPRTNHKQLGQDIRTWNNSEFWLWKISGTESAIMKVVTELKNLQLDIYDV